MTFTLGATPHGQPGAQNRPDYGGDVGGIDIPGIEDCTNAGGHGSRQASAQACHERNEQKRKDAGVFLQHNPDGTWQHSPVANPPPGSPGAANSAARRDQSREKALRSASYRRQCFLINNLDRILKETNHWRRGLPTAQAAGLTNYEMISCIQSNPATLVNQVHGGPGLDDFFDLTTAQQSALVPQVRLWKVWFDKGTPDPSREPEEFIFENHMSKKDIFSITQSRRGRASGIGLISAEIDDQSTMIGETNKRFKVSFKFRFQSMEDILKVINEGADDSRKLRWVDLVTPHPSFVDPNRDAGECEAEANNIYNPDFFIIKASIGWGIPTPPRGRNARNANNVDVLYANQRGPAQKKALKRALEATKKTFFLGLIDHTFDFKQDGTVELSSNYQAFTEAAFTSNNHSDLLFPAMNAAERKKLKRERNRMIERNERRRRGELTAETAAADAESSGGAGSYLATLQHTTISAVARIDKSLRADKAMRYNRIMRNLYRQGLPTFGMWVHKEDIYEIFDPSGATSATTTSSTPISLIQTTTYVDDVLTNAGSQTDATDQVQNRISTQEDIKEQKKKSADPEWVEINFTFLGDLLDIVCTTLRDGSGGMFDTRLLLGPAVLYMGDPKFPERRVEKIVNLADIPVSIKSFETFWLEKVVKPMKDTYKLAEFLRDMVNEFLLQILDAGCLDFEDIEVKSSSNCQDNKTNPVLRKAVALDFLSLDRKGTGRDDPGEPPIPVGEKHWINAENAQDMFRLSEHKGPSQVFHYALLYLNNPSLKGFHGDQEADHEKGIYHLYIGRDRGIVKSMTFKKLDDPLLRASQLSKNIDEGAVLPIPEPYDVTIETFGNALFKPGQKIYVIPSFLSKAGTSHAGGVNLAKRLLIGGYYNILKVNSSIGPGKFTTEIQARWESSGFKPSAQEETVERVPFEQGAFPVLAARDPSSQDRTANDEAAEEFRPGVGAQGAEHSSSEQEEDFGIIIEEGDGEEDFGIIIADEEDEASAAPGAAAAAGLADDETVTLRHHPDANAQNEAFMERTLEDIAAGRQPRAWVLGDPSTNPTRMNAPADRRRTHRRRQQGTGTTVTTSTSEE